MYTRCPECETTFKVGVDDLRRAQGKVRCGDCQHVFNAVEYLTEDPGETADKIPASHRNPPIISSADNPHRDEQELFPANETGHFETPDGDDGYELEIKAYDEKTGEAWSPLENASWHKDSLGNASLGKSARNDSEGDSEDDLEDAFRENQEAEPSLPAEPSQSQGGSEDTPEDSADDEPQIAAEEAIVPDSTSSDDTLAAEIPTWAGSTQEEVKNEAAFGEAMSTDHGLEILPKISEPKQEEPAQAFDDDHGLDDDEYEDSAADAEKVWEADARDILDDDADAESTLETSQTIEMQPIADTEGLPTVEMELSELTADAADEPIFKISDFSADDDDLTDQAEQLTDPATDDSRADDDTEDDFDGTVWERIPGVGAAVAERSTDDELLDDGLSYQTNKRSGGHTGRRARNRRIRRRRCG